MLVLVIVGIWDRGRVLLRALWVGWWQDAAWEGDRPSGGRYDVLMHYRESGGSYTAGVLQLAALVAGCTRRWDWALRVR